MIKLQNLFQFLKFALVGVSNTAVDWIIFFVLKATLIDPEVQTEKNIGKAISFFVAMLNSYLWNTIWTFKNEYKKATAGKDNGKLKKAVFGKFVIASLIGWGINVFVFDLISKNIGYKLLDKEDVLALVAASAAATLWNFFSNKFWTYKK